MADFTPERPSIPKADPVTVAGGADREQIVRRVLNDPGVFPNTVQEDSVGAGSEGQWLRTVNGAAVWQTPSSIKFIVNEALGDNGAVTLALPSGDTLRIRANEWPYLLMEPTGALSGSGFQLASHPGGDSTDAWDIYVEGDVANPDRLRVYSNNLARDTHRFFTTAGGEPGMYFMGADGLERTSIYRGGPGQFILAHNAAAGFPYLSLQPQTAVGTGGGSGIAFQQDNTGGTGTNSFEIYVYDGDPAGPGMHLFSKADNITMMRLAANVGGAGKAGFTLGGVPFTSDGDVNLYRAAANILKTDDQFQPNSISLPDGGAVASIGYLPLTSGAVNDQIIFYRASGGVETGRFNAAGDLELRNKLQFGAAGSPDTNLYRSAANVLKTDDDLVVAGATTLTGAATAPTPAANDNDTSIATTAFVQGELSGQTGYRLKRIDMITAGTTYSVDSDAAALYVECVGGGGQGGGCAATGGAQTSSAAGGGGGAFAATWLTSNLNPGGTLAVVVGAGGSGGAAGANGVAGGDTSFKDSASTTVVLAKGGSGGGLGGAVSTHPAYAGIPGAGGLGTSSTGDVKVSGGAGCSGRCLAVNGNIEMGAGGMGAGPFGGGGGTPSVNSSSAGNGGSLGGGAGCGASNQISQAARAGGAGGAGLIRVSVYVIA